uniref:PARG catalytic Macro domain-containing protein n=1 Tax=Arcella intermedia TaxID=1963864 RepID=A0A6B2L698_9EUKA
MNCLVCYFKSIEHKMPEGHLSITRKVLRKEQYPDYSKSDKPITDIQVTSSLIETFYEHRLHADFANKSIGGGVLHGGNVQEEILFVIKPECLVSMLFCEVMDIDEAIIITGAEQFSKYSGYGGTMRFEGEFQNTTETFRDEEGRTFIKNSIVAFDALMAYGTNQFDVKMMQRDINKAYIALKGEKKTPNEYFVTGNWGCGVFGGDKELKAVQQMIASSEEGINLVYSAFTQEKFKIRLEAFVKFLQSHKVTVGQLYNNLLTYPTFTTLSVFEHIIKEIDPTSSLQPTPHPSESSLFGWTLQDIPFLNTLMDFFKD